MKRLKVIMMALLVACSVFTMAGSALAASVWEARDSSVPYELIFQIDFTNFQQSYANSKFETGEEFGMYATNFLGNTTQYYSLFDHTSLPMKELTLNYDPNTKSFSNGVDVKGSNGTFSFYYKDSSGTYSSLEGTLVPGSSDSYFFQGNYMDEIVKFHDLVPSAVPIPATVLLFGTGLAGLVGLRRRKRDL
ncbi:MAG: VPLPA-CTERM sorting domain-containing protein [Desulfamplus sp.]|nr:VPLPA-CTERM sorting domain-containing protein [Desulfamplus sp.]